MITQDLTTVDFDPGVIDITGNGDQETVLVVEDEVSYQEALRARALTGGLPSRSGL